MALAPEVDGRAVLHGGIVAVVVGLVALLTSVLVDAVADLSSDSNLVFLFFAVLFAGWVAGAATAGPRRPDAPNTHGLLAALLGYAAAIPISVLLSVARDNDVDLLGLLSLVPFALLAGIIGGFIALWRAP